MKRLINIFFVVMILTGCSTYNLKPYETEDVDLSIERGKEIITERKNDIEVSFFASNDKQYYLHSVLIENYSSKGVFFDDANIKLYQGNIESDFWEEIPIYTAEEYYDKVKAESNFMLGLLAVSAIISSVDAGYSSSTTSGSFNSYTSNVSGTFNASTSTYDATAAQIQRIATQQQLSNFVDSSEAEIKNLEQSLLYSSDIASGSSYWGVVFSQKADGPDYKFTITIQGEQYEFYYFRDDREEIINPYIDKIRIQQAIYYSYSQKNEIGVGYGFFSPTIPGFSISAGCHLPDYQSYKYSSLEYVDESGEVQGGYGDYIFTGDQVQFSAEGSIKVNSKIAPYTWISGGIGISSLTDYLLADHYFLSGYYYDTRWVPKESGISVTPKAGVDILFGHWFLSGGVLFDDAWNVGYEIAGGISF